MIVSHILKDLPNLNGLTNLLITSENVCRMDVGCCTFKSRLGHGEGFRSRGLKAAWTFLEDLLSLRPKAEKIPKVLIVHS